MTLILAVTSPESVWLLADRRLSYQGRPPKDDGNKIMFLEATDGVAILGYAGLGKTIAGTEPSDWMSAVLRGRNLRIEQYLEVLARALQEQLPRHMLRMPGSGHVAHHVVVSAFVEGKPRLYTIDLILTPDRKSKGFRFVRHEQKHGAPPRYGLGGSGGLHLFADRRWMRSLARILTASDRKRVTHMAVAHELARLNYAVSQAITDKSVGPQCIVGCRFRKGGGGHWAYEGARLGGNASPPQIAQGFDMRALANLLMPVSLEIFKRMEAGEVDPKPNEAELNASMAQIPNTPDEKLR